MVYRHSLRYRIVKSFCIFSALLGLFYAAFIFVTFAYLEEYLEANLYKERIRGELNAFLAQYHQNPGLQPPRSPYFSIYLDFASVPETLKPLMTGRPDGFYEVEKPINGREGEYNFLIHTIPETGRRVFLIYDAGFLEISGELISAVFGILVAGYILFFFISIWIGKSTSRGIIEPVSHLAEIVKNADPDHLPVDLSASFYNDEVGTLALALEQAMRRIQMFIQREQQFTRNASHELRTPATVIKGAVELIKQTPEFREPGIRNPVSRIERSVVDMEDAVNSFLWLAREKDSIKTDEKSHAADLINEVLTQHRYLIENKSLALEQVHEADLWINAPGPLVKIVLSNLVKNAFLYTKNGNIRIIIKKDRVVVEDTGIGIAPDLLQNVTDPYVQGKDSQGFGIGLSIVKMICERLHWRLEIQSSVKAGTHFQLIFSEPV